MTVYQNINPDVAGALREVVERVFLTDSTYILKVKKEGLKYFAGQHFALGTEEGYLNREYSVYSGINDEHLTFLIKLIENGAVSKKLSDPLTKYIKLHGPYSNFVINEKEIDKKYLFIATGTGVAPFSSFVRTYSNLNYKLLLGTRYSDEQYESKLYGNNLVSCVSREGHAEYKRVTDCLKQLSVDEFDYVYLCGNASMIIDVQNILESKNYTGTVKTEVFF